MTSIPMSIAAAIGATVANDQPARMSSVAAPAPQGVAFAAPASLAKTNVTPLTAAQVGLSYQAGNFVGFVGDPGKPSVDADDRIACKSAGLYPRNLAGIRFQGCQLNRQLSR